MTSSPLSRLLGGCLAVTPFQLRVDLGIRRLPFGD
jgi:hypothetical protein